MITYTYSAEGRVFAKTHVVAEGKLSNRTYLEDELYRVPKTFEIRYDPANPKFSSLDSPWKNWILLALVPVLIGGFFLSQAL